MVRVVREWVSSLLAALQFLTRLPLPARMPDGPGVFRRSTVFFPLAGLAIGAVIAGVGALAELAFPYYASGAFALAAWVIVTGGLHLDGLMDTADGLFSNQPRERMLEIMKDSRSGAMGVIAAMLILLMKGALLAALFADAGRAHYTLLALIPVWSRAFVVLAIAGWPYARSVPGVGSLHRSAGVRHVIGACLLAASLSVPLFVWAGGFGMTETVGFLALYAALAYGTGAGLAAAVSRKLGGLTGDVYGAINEVLELVLLAVIVGMTGH